MLLGVLALPMAARAQEQAQEPVLSAPDTATATPPALPEGTRVVIRVEQALSSKTAKRGDRFPISLVEDVSLGGRAVVAAGTMGVGEVIHAAGKGFGGRAGELIVAARYLDVGGRRLPLRGFRINSAGANNTGEAIAASIAIPLAGLFVTGSSADIAAGQIAEAKTSQSFATDAPITTTTDQQGTNQ
jgi:hypothetical protein